MENALAKQSLNFIENIQIARQGRTFIDNLNKEGYVIRYCITLDKLQFGNPKELHLFTMETDKGKKVSIQPFRS